MNTARTNYIKFLYDSAEENIGETTKELEMAGLNPSGFQTEIEKFVAEFGANAKIERGKKVKEIYERLKARVSENVGLLKSDNISPELAVAFRNLGESLTNEEIEQILMDDSLLDELSERLKE